MNSMTTFSGLVLENPASKPTTQALTAALRAFLQREPRAREMVRRLVSAGMSVTTVKGEGVKRLKTSKQKQAWSQFVDMAVGKKSGSSSRSSTPSRTPRKLSSRPATGGRPSSRQPLTRRPPARTSVRRPVASRPSGAAVRPVKTPSHLVHARQLAQRASLAPKVQATKERLVLQRARQLVAPANAPKVGDRAALLRARQLAAAANARAAARPGERAAVQRAQRLAAAADARSQTDVEVLSRAQQIINVDAASEAYTSFVPSAAASEAAPSASVEPLAEQMSQAAESSESFTDMNVEFTAMSVDPSLPMEEQVTTPQDDYVMDLEAEYAYQEFGGLIRRAYGATNEAGVEVGSDSSIANFFSTHPLITAGIVGAAIALIVK